jgi:hypothetical protein
MLTVAERKHDDSDSEDDADYIPPVATGHCFSSIPLAFFLNISP